MNAKELAEKKRRLQKELSDIERQEVQLANLSIHQRVATLLHEKLCRYNHTDGCGWYYDEWNFDNDEHKSYVKAANDLLTMFNEKEIENFVEVIKKCC